MFFFISVTQKKHFCANFLFFEEKFHMKCLPKIKLILVQTMGSIQIVISLSSRFYAKISKKNFFQTFSDAKNAISFCSRNLCFFSLIADM